jgi:hypothetical protein
VRDAAGGVAGALVTLAPEGQAGQTTRHYADADGHVAVGNLIPGTHVGKFARSAAHPAMPLRVEVSDASARGPSVLLLPSGSLRLTLRGPRGPVVDALVVAPERAVFTGRQMTISPDGKGGVTVTDHRPDGARSDAFGVAVLTDLPAGEHTVRVEHDDFTAASFTIDIGDGLVTHALDLSPAGRALVRVRNAQGQASPRAWLLVETLRPEQTDQAGAGRTLATGGWQQLADELVLHGERTLTALPPGRYRVAAALQPGTRMGEAVEFEVRAGERTEVTVVLPD